jgi:hypothetical protein
MPYQKLNVTMCDIEKYAPHLSVVSLEVEVHALPEALRTQQRVVQTDDLRALQTAETEGTAIGF